MRIASTLRANEARMSIARGSDIVVEKLFQRLSPLSLFVSSVLLFSETH